LDCYPFTAYFHIIHAVVERPGLMWINSQTRDGWLVIKPWLHRASPGVGKNPLEQALHHVAIATLAAITEPDMMAKVDAMVERT
jgi:hypothetical protein